ncbi:hypothetical protein BLS_008066 [Venturia inaequalis]|uniref:Uncharacterized protein n=1 Tax=Venturia inaequalis TaxID=5025 RepID=A0A8H3U9T5_VENIN|nr:hypothetical protein BLS_008066 [Venturia inaequalis]
MASANNSDHDEISLIIARAAMSVPLPSLDATREAPRTKGEQMKLILENMKIQHDQIRKQIFAQCPRSIPRTTITELQRQALDKQRTPEGPDDVGKGILELLRAPYTAMERTAPRFAQPPVVEPNQRYGKPLPQTQVLQMQPFLRDLAPILQALDTFNLHAFNELVGVEKEKEKLESNGTARTPLANVTAKKRSAHEANLNKSHNRPPLKRSVTSSIKDIEKSAVKRSVSFAQTNEEIMSEKRRDERIKLEHSSPTPQASKLPANFPDRPKGPIPAPIRDHGYSNTDHKPAPYAIDVTSNDSSNNRDFRTNEGSDKRGPDCTIATNGACDLDRTILSSPKQIVRPSRMDQVQTSPLLSSPVKAREKIPRPSSRDPRLIHKNLSLKGR